MEGDSLTRVLQLTKVLRVVGLDTDAEANKARDASFKSLVKESRELGQKRVLEDSLTPRDQKAYALVNTLLGAKPLPARRTVTDKYADPPFNMFLKKPFGPRVDVFLKRMREDHGLQKATAEQTVLDVACSCSRMKWLSKTKEHVCGSCWQETMRALFHILARACVIIARTHADSLRELTKISMRDLSDVCTSLSSDLARVRAHCRQVARRNVDWLAVVDDMFHILVRVVNVLLFKVGLENLRLPNVS
jgi:hypothetical protein